MKPVQEKKVNGMTVIFPKEMQEAMRNVAEKEYTSVSTIARKAVAEYLEKYYNIKLK